MVVFPLGHPISKHMRKSLKLGLMNLNFHEQVE